MASESKEIISSLYANVPSQKQYTMVLVFFIEKVAITSHIPYSSYKAHCLDLYTNSRDAQCWYSLKRNSNTRSDIPYTLFKLFVDFSCQIELHLQKWSSDNSLPKLIIYIRVYWWLHYQPWTLNKLILKQKKKMKQWFQRP